MADARLRSIPLFAEFGDDDLEQIGAATTQRQLKAGERLFDEGDHGDHAYVIVDGELEILKTSGQREVLLAVRKAGEVIGEMSLLEGAPRMAAARAKCATILLDVPKDVFDEVVATSAVAARALFGVLLSRWRETEARLRQQEQLAQLGTLAAGLAHELNNPAAAAKRAAAGFEAAAERMATARAAIEAESDDPTAVLALAESLAAAETVRLGGLARGDREEALIARLKMMGVDRPASAAGGLVDIEAGTVDRLLDEADAENLSRILAMAIAAREVQSLASVALDAAGRISNIVGAVKSYAFMDQAPIQEVDLTGMLDDTLVLLHHKLGDIEVVREFDEVPPFPAYGSELNQVWTNLLDNAADAIREAERDPGRIAIRTRVDGEDALVEIEDDGPGISTEVLPRVFDSFFTTKAPGSGTGLGLDISYGIVVHRHGGRIDIDTEPGRTAMQVRLPLAGP